MRKAIILCSGGLDSVTTAYHVKNSLSYNSLMILFFNYNQKSIKRERELSRKTASKLKAKFMEIKLPELSNISNSLINKKGKVAKLSLNDLKDTKSESSKWYVPQRNLTFITYALAMADSLFIKNKEKSDVFLGFKCEGSDSYPDTTKEFLSAVNTLSKVSSVSQAKIIAPLIDKDKEDIILLGKKLGINFKDTFSCYTGKNTHCGQCLACRLRQEGFYWANIRDPTEYKKKMKDFRTSKD